MTVFNLKEDHRMKSRTEKFVVVFLGIIMICLLLIAFQARPAQAQIKLTYANTPPSTAFPCVQMERWAKEVERRTNGKVKVQTFPGGTLLAPKIMYDGTVQGQADISNPTMGYQPGRFPVSEAFDLPIGFTNSKAASLALYDYLMKNKPKEFEQTKILTAFTSAPAGIMSSRPVKSLKDLKGLELRVSGTSSNVVKALGGTPVAMPMPDTPEALQKGVVKGIVSSMEVLKDFNFAAYCPYATEANLFAVSFVVVMNIDKWNSLPADVKKVIDDLGREHALWTGTYADNHVKEALEWSKQKYKHQVFQLSASDKSEIPKLMKPIVDDYIKRMNAKGLPGEQIVKDVLTLRDKYEKQFK
jgi:TRAP-type C4-dicarboxylate transport system substrate-binding protein